MRRRTPLVLAVVACLTAVPAGSAALRASRSVQKARQALNGYVRQRRLTPTEALATRSPVNKALPAISGATVVGSKLNASRGTWTGSSLTYSYQWQRCSSTGVACAAIANANVSTYTLASSDSGNTLRVAVTARNKYGRSTASSDASAVVTTPQPATTSPPPPATPTPPPPTATGGGDRYVYCFGSPTWWNGGFLGDDTSLGWARQYGQSPSSNQGMVGYDSSVDVMNSLGCETMRASIAPSDPTDPGGCCQRAQVITSDSMQAAKGDPAFGVVRGETHWYGFAFSTNAGYKPQSATYPDWNNIFIWHGNSGAPFCGLAVAVSTKVDTNGSYSNFPDGQAHLSLDLWGNSVSNPGFTQEYHFYDPRPFQPGHRYTIEMKVLWGDSNTGGVEWWVDGMQVTPFTTGLTNMAVGYGLYPIFENYRPNASAAGITWTNTVYYGGLVKGSSLADVSVP
jgi:Polysaccharide lyase